MRQFGFWPIPLVVLLTTIVLLIAGAPAGIGLTLAAAHISNTIRVGFTSLFLIFVAWIAYTYLRLNSGKPD